MGLATVNTHEPTGFLKKQNRSQSDQQQAGQSKVFHLSANQSMIFNFQTSDGQFKYTDRLKAPLPDFKNIEYKGEKPWKSTEASKDFIKKVILKIIFAQERHHFEFYLECKESNSIQCQEGRTKVCRYRWW